jgi:hypothetical protein
MTVKYVFVASESVDYYMKPASDGVDGHEFTDEEIAGYLHCHEQWHRWQITMHNAMKARIEAHIEAVDTDLLPPMPGLDELG